MPVLIHKFATHIRTPEGVLYEARSYAEPQRDGTWVGWLQFDPVDTDNPSLVTGPETTQALQAAVETWAEGVESTYLQGAFERAHLLPAVPDPIERF